MKSTDEEIFSSKKKIFIINFVAKQSLSNEKIKSWKIACCIFARVARHIIQSWHAATEPAAPFSLGIFDSSLSELAVLKPKGKPKVFVLKEGCERDNFRLFCSFVIHH